jgi:hypothetical protein
VLYIAVAVVLTGIVPWHSLIDDAAPVVNSMSMLAGTTKSALLHWTELVVLFGAMMGMISSLLVFQLGQARVWFSMSRDGLLPKMFSRVHPRFRTPATATWIAGFLVGIPAGILDIGTLSDLSNIGTLFAFVLVSLGVIILRYKQPDRRRGFRAPGGLAAPILSVVFCILLMAGLPILTWLRFFRVADHRNGRVLALQPPSQRVQPTQLELRPASGDEAVTDNFIASLPKAELHLHLEGTVDPPTLSELSRRHPTPLETTNNRYRNIEDSGRVFTEDEARELYQYKHFTGFMWAFKAVTERLRTADDYELVTYRMMQKLHAQNVLHAEVVHLRRGGAMAWTGFRAAVRGAERGRQRGERDFGISLYWILDAVRHFGVTRRSALSKRPSG